MPQLSSSVLNRVTDEAPLIEVTDLAKSYGSGPRQRSVLGPVTMSVARGGFVAVMGQSGSGKSTLLHLVGGLLRPTDGDVVVAGRPLGRLSDDDLAEYRRR